MGKTTKTNNTKGDSPKKAESKDSKNTVKSSGQSGDGKKEGKSAEVKIMEVLAKMYAANTTSVEKEKILNMTGIAPKTLSNTIPKLKRKGFIEVDKGVVELTEAGINEMGDMAKQAGSNEEIQEKIKEDLSVKQVEIMDALLDGKIHSKEALARNLNYKDGAKTKTFVNAVGGLSGKKIVIYPSKGDVQINEEKCFPFGK